LTIAASYAELHKSLLSVDSIKSLQQTNEDSPFAADCCQSCLIRIALCQVKATNHAVSRRSIDSSSSNEDGNSSSNEDGNSIGLDNIQSMTVLYNESAIHRHRCFVENQIQQQKQKYIISMLNTTTRLHTHTLHHSPPHLFSSSTIKCRQIVSNCLEFNSPNNTFKQFNHMSTVAAGDATSEERVLNRVQIDINLIIV
jgi:hypothetical protein